MSQWFGCSRTRGFLIVVLAGMLAGCNKHIENSPPGQTEAPASPVQPEAKDERTRWIYDTGWFAQGNGTAWFEHNDEATRIQGGPWEFTETKRTPEYVELYDARRGVSVRLKELVCEARWDKDGANAEWQPFCEGRWENRE